MPIIPPSVSVPYDPVSNIMRTAQVRLNDEISTLEANAGQMVLDTEAFTQQAVNTSWRKLMEYLANLGLTRLIDEVVIPSIPVVASLDPATQCWIDWTGCSDGVNVFTAPALPYNMIFPLKIWERVSGQNACFPACSMEQILDGIPSIPKQWANGMWEWRNDRIYYPGSQVVEDFRLRFAFFLPDFVDVGITRWFEQPVPLPRVQSAFAWYLCAEFVGARGDESLADVYRMKAEADANLIMNREIRQKQRVNVRRQARSGPAARHGGGWGIL